MTRTARRCRVSGHGCSGALDVAIGVVHGRCSCPPPPATTAWPSRRVRRMTQRTDRGAGPADGVGAPSSLNWPTEVLSHVTRRPSGRLTRPVRSGPREPPAAFARPSWPRATPRTEPPTATRPVPPPVAPATPRACTAKPRSPGPTGLTPCQRRSAEAAGVSAASSASHLEWCRAAQDRLTCPVRIPSRASGSW